MKRINKCRTLGEFNEAVLKQTMGQSAESSSQTTQQAKTDGQQAPSTQIQEKGKSIENKDNLTPSTENKSQQQQKEPSGQADKQQDQQAATNYLFFGPDEFIITTYKMENGWWYGYKDTGDVNAPQGPMGFFPSNFVQVVEEFPEEVVTAPTEEEKEEHKDDPFGGTKVDWRDYAHSNYLNEAQLVLEERLRKLDDPNAPENRNGEGLLRYKKVKIHESRSHAVNEWKGGKVTYGQKPVRDQSAVGKAYRQMHHYFDYDKWIDERNANPKPKAKADPTKKKKKQMPEWLKKLGMD